HQMQQATRPVGGRQKPPKETGEDKATVHAGAGKLNIIISADSSEAAVGDFDVALYDDPTFQVTLEWIENELLRNGVKLGLADDLKKPLSEAISRRESLAGKTVAQAEPGRGGKGPRLHKSYKDAQARGAANLEADHLDIR